MTGAKILKTSHVILTTRPLGGRPSLSSKG